jgi:cation transport regulator ChaC
MTEDTRGSRFQQNDAQSVKDATEARRRAELNRTDNDGEPRREADDVSPHFGGRAQPGDVLGLETGGETTGIGDTAEDEDERRRAAEKADREKTD